MSEFVFVLEQTLGHVAHARNLERVLARESSIDATIVPIPFDQPRGWHVLPGLSNWSFRASWRARQELSRAVSRRPSAIFIHTQVASLLAVDLMRRTPTVVSLDATPRNFDDVGATYEHRSSNPLFEAVKRGINQRSYSAAAGLVTWCAWAARSLSDDYAVSPEKVRVIAPGVDLELFSPSRRTSKDAVRLLFVGGDFDRKGGPDLLQALDWLGARVDVDLVTGSDFRLASVRPNVRVHHGLKPQSAELVRLYREADLFVLPSRGDCFPQAIAEAMACGLPVVATAVGAIPELVRDGDTGLIVPPAAPLELYRALDALVADESRRRSMGNRGFEVARRDHDMARNNRRILAFMSELAAARSLALGVG